MTTSTTNGARGAWPPRATRPSTRSERVRGHTREEIALLGNLDVPPLDELDLDTATATEFRTAVMRFVEAHYEDDTELAARLRLEAEDMRGVHLARVHEAMDQANAVIREERQALGRRPLLSELEARRRRYPEPRPMAQTPGWPDPLVPGTGRRLSELQNESGAA